MTHVIEEVLVRIKEKTKWEVDCKELITFCHTHDIVPTDYSQLIDPMIDRIPQCSAKYHQFITDTLLFMLVDELAILSPSAISSIIEHNTIVIPARYNDFSIPQRLAVQGMLNFSPSISSLIIEHPLIQQLFDSPHLWRWESSKKPSTQQWLNSCHFTAHANILIAKIPTVIHAILVTCTYISNDKSLRQRCRSIMHDLASLIDQIRIDRPSDSVMLSKKWSRLMQMFFASSYADFRLVTYWLSGWWYTSASIRR